MKYFPLLWICLIVMPLYGQDNYLEYHQAFCEIESLLLEENFEEAALNVSVLLQKYDTPFVKDWGIAAQILLLNGQTDEAVNHLLKAFEKGYPIECLESVPIFKNTFSAAQKTQLKESFQNYRQIYLTSIDQEVYLNFQNRYELEQKTKGTSNYEQVVNANFEYIQKYWKTGRFPGIQYVGIDQPLKLNLSFITKDKGTNGKLSVTLLHATHPIAKIGLSAFLDAIRAGELHPDDFAKIYTFEKQRVSVLYQQSLETYPPIPIYHFNLAFDNKSKDLDQVNKDRTKFGICPLENDQKRKTIELKYGLRLG